MNERIYTAMLGELWAMAAHDQTARAFRLFEDTLMEAVELRSGKVAGIELSSAESNRLQWLPVHQGGPFSPKPTPYDPQMAILRRF